MKTFLLAVLMMTMTACASSGGDSGPNVGNTPTNGIPSGDYRACYLTSGSGYANTIVNYTATTFSILTTYYANPGCTGSVLGSATGSGNYTTTTTTIDYYYTSHSTTTIYDIYQVSGTTLNVGDRTGANDGSTLSKRPTTYSSTIVFTKQ